MFTVASHMYINYGMVSSHGGKMRKKLVEVICSSLLLGTGLLLTQGTGQLQDFLAKW